MRLSRAFALFALCGTSLGVLAPLSDSAAASSGSVITSVIGSDMPGPMSALYVRMDPSAVSATGSTAYVSGGYVVRRVTADGTETIVAGDGSGGDTGDGGPATEASLLPGATTLDASGNLLIDDAHRLRVVAGSSGRFYGVDMTAGNIYTVAGTGTAGSGADGVTATSSPLQGPTAVALDRQGNVVLGDGSRIRVLAASTGVFYGMSMVEGDVYTIAGTQSAGYGGDGGPASQATFRYVDALAIDTSGDLVVDDSGNARVRVIAEHAGTAYGVNVSAGDVYTVAGTGTKGFSGDGGVATAAQISPKSLALDRAGDIVLSDTGNSRLRVVSASGGVAYGQSLSAGEIQTVAISQFVSPPVPSLPQLNRDPYDIAVDAADNILVTVPSFLQWPAAQSMVQVVAASAGTFYGQSAAAGQVLSFGYDAPGAVDGQLPLSMQMRGPLGVTVDGAGNMIYLDDRASVARVLASSTGTFYGLSMAAGHLYTVAGAVEPGSSVDGGPARQFVFHPTSVTVDPDGNLLLSDPGHGRVYLVAGSDGTFYGQPRAAGHLYTLAGDGFDGDECSGLTSANNGDGGPATAGELCWPSAVALDEFGNVLILDPNDGRVRVVANAAGVFYGVSMTPGAIYTVAGGGSQSAVDGGAALAANLSGYQGIASDHQGNLLLSDPLGFVVQAVAMFGGSSYGRTMTAGNIYTINKGTQARALAVDNAGNVAMATTDNKIVILAESSGFWYGTQMSPGNQYTIAGSGNPGFFGDGGPASSAEMNTPRGPVIDPGGNLLFADYFNDSIRQITGGPAAPIQPPSQPRNLRAAPMGASVALSWLPPAQFGGQQLTGYVVYRSTSTTSPGDAIATTTATAFTDTTAASDVHYYYRVQADNSTGAGPQSAAADATPDITPPTVTMSAPGTPFQRSNLIGIRYAATDPGTGIASYDLRVRQATWTRSFGSYQYPAGWQNTTLSNQALHGAPGSQYCFSVRARDQRGNVSTWTPDRCTSTARPIRWTTQQNRRLVLSPLRLRQVALVIDRCPNCGPIIVYLNNKRWVTVRTASSATTRHVLVTLPRFTLRTVTISLGGTSVAAHLEGIAPRQFN